jgi:hypothetical protein
MQDARMQDAGCRMQDAGCIEIIDRGDRGVSDLPDHPERLRPEVVGFEGSPTYLSS